MGCMSCGRKYKAKEAVSKMSSRRRVGRSLRKPIENPHTEKPKVVAQVKPADLSSDNPIKHMVEPITTPIDNKLRPLADADNEVGGD